MQLWLIAGVGLAACCVETGRNAVAEHGMSAGEYHSSQARSVVVRSAIEAVVQAHGTLSGDLLCAIEKMHVPAGILEVHFRKTLVVLVGRRNRNTTTCHPRHASSTWVDAEICELMDADAGREGPIGFLKI